MNDTPWIEARTIDQENVRETFALAARHVLADAAMDYNAVVYLPDFAKKLQERTRIRYRATPSSWAGDVLYRVARDCQRRAEPFLGALVVNSDGSMPEWWADTVEMVRGERVSDPNLHAAEERLECYRRHGAILPSDGGTATLPTASTRASSPRASTRSSTPRATTSRAATGGTRRPGTGTARAAAAPAATKPAEPVVKVCMSCFMAMPATGICDTCD